MSAGSVFHTRARVIVAVEVSCGSYGSNCTLEQIQKQAGAEGVQAVTTALQGIGGRVIGEPIVGSVSTCEAADPLAAIFGWPFGAKRGAR